VALGIINLQRLISNQYKTVLTVAQELGISKNRLPASVKTLQGKETDP